MLIPRRKLIVGAAATAAMSLLPTDADAAIAIVGSQVVAQADTATNTTTATLPSAPTVGNTVVAVSWHTQDATGQTATIVDGASHTYTQVAGFPVSNAFFVADVTVAFLNVVSGATAAVTATWTTPGGFDIAGLILWEFSGMATSPFDTATTDALTSSTSTAINTPSITPTLNGDLFIAWALGDSISAVNSPFTGAVGPQGSGYGYFVQGSHGAQAVNMTQSPAGHYFSLLATFKASGGAARPRNFMMQGI